MGVVDLDDQLVPACGHEACVHAVGRQLETLGDDDAHAAGIDVHRGRGIAVLGDDLEAHPAAAVARELPAEHAEVEDLLHVGRVEHRDTAGFQDVLALVREGGGLGGWFYGGAAVAAVGAVGLGVSAVLASVERWNDTPFGDAPLTIGLDPAPSATNGGGYPPPPLPSPRPGRRAAADVVAVECGGSGQR